MKLPYLLDCENAPDMDITGISSDSRSVRRGYLFVAVEGVQHDGREYIQDAVRHGAKAILVPAGTPIPDYMNDIEDVAWIENRNTRLMLAQAASRFYGAQPETIVAVTGTNGKTSTVTFARQIWEKLGFRAASLGTLGLQGINIQQPGSMTTPDAVRMHAQLADIAAEGVDHLAVEASSHGLDQHRLDGMNITAAGFTNLTLDHLDYHGTMEHYAKSKKYLFEKVLHKDGIAVVNADTAQADDVRRICEEREITFWSYGYKGEEFKILSREATPHGQKVSLRILGQEIDMTLPLVGEFQLMNLLCATGLVLARCQKRVQEVIDILPLIKGAAGRLEYVEGHTKSAAVFVDYAHTPDALENVLNALRPHTTGRLICVFGCGGNRDKSKRPIMGKIATDLADMVIVTDDNPRNEDPAQIRSEIMDAALGATEIGDRRQAIATAIRVATAGDVVVIAGKGHEQGQIIGDTVEPFDDVKEAHLAMETS